VPELALSAITETRYCISDHLLWLGAPLVRARSPLLRMPLPRSDTVCRTSCKDFGYAGRPAGPAMELSWQPTGLAG
jgi:hypothetical protein